jgi:hypothetical protein
MVDSLSAGRGALKRGVVGHIGRAFNVPAATIF